ncbi:MAG: PrsW family intramembrane metalloprotease [Acidobacteria bacterium]|nr:PrsW family intramembrane metalloprotease [Acidobacteriota bacterium]MCW5971239.1 PrsW family intramembrane metalloprotease [Blastocatellales bacterium]
MKSVGNFILISTLSLLPCALWLWYFAGYSRYKRPPSRLIAATFALGALSTIPALALNFTGQQAFLHLFGRSEATRLAILFFIVAPIEELLKLLVVYAYPYRRPEFDEPLDGVVYSAAAALGFAAVENAVYIAETGPMLVLLRGPLTNPGHALFSALWGLSLARAKAAPNFARARLPIVAGGLLAASLLHGVFDLLLVAAAQLHAAFLAVVAGAVLALFLWVRSRLRFYRDNSPHREGTMLMRSIALCAGCGARGDAGAACPECGLLLPEPEETIRCQVCLKQQPKDAGFCTMCGANLRLPPKVAVESRPHFVTLAPSGAEHIAFILNQDRIDVGRTLNNGFVIEHPSVSKRHARLIADCANYALHDLGSINGTFVNGRRIAHAPLEDGCEVRFGQASFVYRGGRREITEQTK